LQSKNQVASVKKMRLMRECDIHFKNSGLTKLKVKPHSYLMEVLRMWARRKRNLSGLLLKIYLEIG